MLNQDTSRNFLHSSNSSAKYKLFMRGTHLDQIAHDYARAEEQQRLMKEEIERKMSLVPELEMKAKQLEEEVYRAYPHPLITPFSYYCLLHVFCITVRSNIPSLSLFLIVISCT